MFRNIDNDKFISDFIKSILLGIIIGAIVILGIMQCQNNLMLLNRIDILDSQVSSSDIVSSYTIKGIASDITDLNKQIVNLPERERITKIKLEYKLRQAIVMIYNKTDGSMGSGVTIKYKDEFYILSAGHMANSEEDILTFGENDQEIGKLKIIKHDFVTPDDITQGTDLILLQPTNKNLVPQIYVELADFEAQAPTEVYVVGNPAGIEDVLCEGRIIQYVNNYLYYINHTYFGNSGGGVFTLDGKLLGIVSHMYPISYNPVIPPYMTYGAVRLSKILEFLGDIE